MKKMKQLLSSPLGIALLLLPLAIISKNLLGAGRSELSSNDYFDIEVLKRGMIKGLLIYAGIGVLAFMATLSKDMTVAIDGSTYSLIDAMTLIVSGAVTVYVYGAIEILMDIFKSPTKEGANKNE